jgi:hypothetical protein
MISPQTPSFDAEPLHSDSTSAPPEPDSNAPAPACDPSSAPSESDTPSPPPEPAWTPPTYTPAPDLRAAMDEVLLEESAAYEQRLTRWRKLANPRTDFEEFLVLILVNLSFELERAGRAYEEQLRAQVESAVENEHLKVRELSNMLFHDPCGPTPLYALRPDVCNPTHTSWNGLANDPLDPAVLVMKIEKSATGCRHLREIWTELRSRIEPGSFWQPLDRLRAIRMCGCNPVDAAANKRIAEIYLASYTLNNGPDHAWTDLMSDMGRPMLELYRDRVRARYPDLLHTLERARGKKILIDLVEGNIARLSAKIEEFDAKTREKAQQTLARLGFDHSPEGERITRFKTRCKSDLFKAINMYKSIRSKRNSIAGSRGEVESGGANQTPDDSVASVIEQAENLLRAFAPDDASPASAPQPSKHASATNVIPTPASFPQTCPEVTPATRLEARPEVACAPHTAAYGAASATRDDAMRGLSRREKRKARREQRERALKRPSPPSPPPTREAHPPTPPSIAVPKPDRGDIIKPGVSTPALGTSSPGLEPSNAGLAATPPGLKTSPPGPGVSIPGLDVSTLGSNSPFGATNALIRKLLESSPEAKEYLQSFVKTPGPLGSPG